MAASLLLVLTCVLAAAVALYLAPPIIRAAHRYGIMDMPDAGLKDHAQPVAYLGGLVVFLAMLVALAVTQSFNTRMLAMLLGASLVVTVGLVDDLGTLVPKDKFLGQLLAAAVLVKGGVAIQMDAVPWYVADLASAAWIVTVINAFNIIDVNDGLCAGVGATASGIMAGWLYLQHQLPEAFLCAALCGALVGFLRHNWQPARMYLGDTGSMLVGVVLAAAVMLADWSDVNSVAAMVSPLAVLGVPLFDVTFVVVVRLVLGLRIWHGSPDHFAVRLRRHGRSASAVAAAACVVTAASSGAALLAANLSDGGAAAVAGGGVVVCLVAGVYLWRLNPRLPAFAPAPRTHSPAAAASEPARDPANR